MEIYCAWCGTRMGEERAAGEPPEADSHGICPDCAVALLNEDGTPVEEFLHRLGVPTFLVGGDFEVLDANPTALAWAGKPAATVLGRLGGEVFECLNSALPEGCGRTVHCSGCTLRRTITATFEDGRPRLRVPASLKVRRANEPETVELLVTTARVDGRVLVRIEPAP